MVFDKRRVIPPITAPCTLPQIKKTSANYSFAEA
jgi:hypothetical protein